MPVTCLLVEHRGRGRYFFRWKLPCYPGLRPSHGHVGAHEWFAQRLYEGMIFFQRVQGLVRGCGERRDAPGGALLIPERGRVPPRRPPPVADSLPATGEARRTAASLLSRP